MDDFLLDVDRFLATLAAERPIFHSEADFQHAFAWLLHKQYPHAQIRLEYPLRIEAKPYYLDLWMRTDQFTVGIELKYKTHSFKEPVQLGDEKFHLANQSAQDTGRYDYIKDIQRLERVTQLHSNVIGYAIMVTNESSYRSVPQNVPTSVDVKFRIHDNQRLRGTLGWGPGTSAGTMRSRESALELRQEYQLKWQDYSDILTDRYGIFRYLAVEIKHGEITASTDSVN